MVYIKIEFLTSRCYFFGIENTFLTNYIEITKNNTPKYTFNQKTGKLYQTASEYALRNKGYTVLGSISQYPDVNVHFYLLLFLRSQTIKKLPKFS